MSQASSVKNEIEKQDQTSRVASYLAWVGVGLGLALGMALSNPALGLLAGLAVRLGLDVNPIPNSSKLSKYALQTAIVLLGFTLGLEQLVSVSAQYGLMVAAFIGATAGFGWLLYWLVRSNPQESILLTAGTGICGGTAIATLAPLMRAEPQQLAVASALVFLLNVVAVFTFPAIGHWLGLSQEVFGAWVALAVHDTSSVVATAAAYGDQAAQVATTVKLGRTLWLIPLAFVFSIVWRAPNAKVRVPGFVLLFVATAALSSWLALPEFAIEGIGVVSKSLLVVALTLIGLEINRATLRQLSPRIVFFGIGLWLLVAPLALVLVQGAA